MTLFETKAHFSRLVQEVAESHDEIVVTVRGMPKVRIVPYDSGGKGDIWEVREKVITEYGNFDLTLPKRSSEPIQDPFLPDETI